MSLAIALWGVGGCDRPEYAHFGEWTIGKTKLKDATGRCEPTTFASGARGVFCFGQRPAHIGDQRANVDLYFGKDEPSAPLIELQLSINACKTEPVEGWLRTTIGQPKTTSRDRLIWETTSMLALAELPNQEGNCKIRIFPPSERPEFDRLTR